MNPQEIQLIVSKEISGKNWNLYTLMVILGEELRGQLQYLAPVSERNPAEQPTATTLFAGVGKPTASMITHSTHVGSWYSHKPSLRIQDDVSSA